jgi:hypothetical protein
MAYPEEYDVELPVGTPPPRPYDDTTQLQKRINRHLDEVARLERRAEFLSNLPDEPMGDDGTTVIWFEKTMGSRVYTYAAVRTKDGLWSTTGPKSPKRYRWNELVQWIYDGDLEGVEVWFANGWEQL